MLIIQTIIIIFILLLGIAALIGKKPAEYVSNIKNFFSRNFYTRTMEQDDSTELQTSYVGANNGTDIMTILIAEQLDPKTSNVVKTYNIRTIPKDGVSISRPNAAKGIYHLDGCVKSAYSVSEEHLIIKKTQNGFTAYDNHSSNGTRIQGFPKHINEITLKDNMVLILGEQPIRFRFPKPEDLFNAASQNNFNFSIRSDIITYD